MTERSEQPPIQPEVVSGELLQSPQLFLAALKAESECLEAAAKVKSAEGDWQKARQRAIANNPRTANLSEECAKAHTRCRIAVEKNFEPTMKEALKKNLDSINRRLAKASKRVLQGDPGVIEALKRLEAARSTLQQVNQVLLEERSAALEVFKMERGVTWSWSQLEELLDLELKKEFIDAHRVLVRTEEDYNHSGNLILSNFLEVLPQRPKSDSHKIN